LTTNRAATRKPAAFGRSEGLKGNPESVADKKYLPKSSHDEENPFAHRWPKFGGTE
jgi:hypothetical protein